jgi:hypothetical protein
MYPAGIVAGPRLLESRARTVEQTRRINTLCRFAEMAGAQASVDVTGSARLRTDWSNDRRLNSGPDRTALSRSRLKPPMS